MRQKTGQPTTQESSVDGQPTAGPQLSTSSAIIAARVADWAASHTIRDDALLLNVRRVIEGALSDYFRFLNCDGSLMVFKPCPVRRERNASDSAGGGTLLARSVQERC